MGKPPSGPSSEDIDIYKELLAEYQLSFPDSADPLDLNTLNDYLSSSNFVIEEFKAVDNFWSPTLEIIEKDNNEVSLYAKRQALMLPYLTEEEKLLHFNYLSTILTHDYIQLPNKPNNDINAYDYFFELRVALLDEAHEILDTHAQITEYKTGLFQVYSVMIIGSTLAICLSILQG